MAVSYSKAISQDGNTLVITDQTTGYGVDLPARNTLGLLVYGVHNKSSEDVPVGFQTYDPSTSNTFFLDVTDKDGVYTISMFLLPKWSSGTLAEGQVVLDMNDLTPKKYVGGQLEALTLEQLLSEGVDQYTDKVIVRTQIQIIRDELTLENVKKLQDYKDNRCDYHEYLKASTDYQYVNALLEGALISFCRGQYVQAQKKVETGIVFGKPIVEQLKGN